MTDRKHIAQFGLLVIIFTLGIYIYFTTTFYWIQLLDGVIMAVLYPIWGIWHHHEHGHLNRSIIIEYILVGLISLIGLLALL